jgi:hypothetical protein
MKHCFQQERLGPEVVRRAFVGGRCLQLVSVPYWQASQRWQGLAVSEIERRQLRQFRRELGLLDQNRIQFELKYDAPASATDS